MLSFLLGCQPTPPVITETDKRPDIVLITIDTLRADRIGAYGDTLAKTPNLDKLAQEGWLFTESHAVTPLTLPSHTSILTGLLPKEHGIRDNAGFSLDEKHVTIAEALSDSGYSTGAFVSAFVLDQMDTAAAVMPIGELNAIQSASGCEQSWNHEKEHADEDNLYV